MCRVLGCLLFTILWVNCSSAISLTDTKQFLLQQLGLPEEPQVTRTQRGVPSFIKAVFHSFDMADRSWPPPSTDQALRARPAQIRSAEDPKAIRLTFDLSLELPSVAQLNLVFQHHRKQNNSSSMETSVMARVCHPPSGICGFARSIRRKVQDSSTQWEIFDISFLLADWHTARLTFLPSVTLDIHFLEPAIQQDLPYKMVGINGPLLLAWSEKEDLSNAQNLHSRSRRSVPQPEETPITGIEEHPIFCSLRNWFVSFRDLDWHHWIIQPDGYEANFCQGLCPEPLNGSQVLATNHAYVKSVYRFRHPSMAHLPAAYCVPFSLRPMSMLYSYNDTINMRRMNEVMANSCGCL